MIYYLLSVLAAVLISVMIVVNGALTEVSSVYQATAIIHVVGLCAISLICLLRRERLFYRGIPALAYLGGAFGVILTVFNNLSFGRISVSAIVGLGLLGQTVTALAIDQFGLLDMPVRRFGWGKLLGVLLTLAGVAVLLTDCAFAPGPVAASLLAGACVVLSRSFNARLGARTGTLASSWYNYFVGLACALALLLLSGGSLFPFPAVPTSGLWLYMGGLMGLAAVLMLIIVTPRMPAFHQTLIQFAGQIFAGILLDVLLSQGFSWRNLVGGLCAAAGLFLNVWLDRTGKKTGAGA